MGELEDSKKNSSDPSSDKSGLIEKLQAENERLIIELEKTSIQVNVQAPVKSEKPEDAASDEDEENVPEEYKGLKKAVFSKKLKEKNDEVKQLEDDISNLEDEMKNQQKVIEDLQKEVNEGPFDEDRKPIKKAILVKQVADLKK